MAEREMLIDVDDIITDVDGAYDPDLGVHKTIPARKPEPKPIKQADLDALSRSLESERVARTRAESDAQRAYDTARRLAGRATETQVQAYGAHLAKVNTDLGRITGAIASTKGLADAAEREVIAAEAELANPDLDPNSRVVIAERKARAQRELSRAEAELVALETGKHGAEAAVNEAKKYWEASAAEADQVQRQLAEPQQQEKKAPTPDEWIDACPAATRPWLREHREFATDPKMHGKLMRYAQDYAEDNGGAAALDSADFVAALNQRFFPKQEEERDTRRGDDGDGDDGEPPRTRSAPAAPVSRSSVPSGGGSRGSQIRLDAAEIRTAHDMYPEMSPEDARKKYAQNKARAIRDGLYRPRE